MKLQGEFWKAFQGFVMDRTERSMDRFEGRGEYMRHLREVERLEKELSGKTAAEQWEILDQISTEHALAEGIVTDATYLQGMSDGLVLGHFLGLFAEPPGAKQ